MASLALSAVSPLGGYNHIIDDIVLREVSGKALVSIAIAKGKERDLSEVFSKKYKTKLPAVGNATASSDGAFQLLGMQRDQIFAMFDDDGFDAAVEMHGKLGGAGYCCDQSDSWAMLSISGKRSREALERICMLDLAPDVFTTGTVARTIMEHLAVIIIRTGDNDFLLLSPRSSAKSFLTTIETSIRNIL